MGTRAKGQSQTAAANKERGKGQREGGAGEKGTPTQSDERRERGSGQGGQVEEQTASKEQLRGAFVSHRTKKSETIF